jgi:tetratricopeptide (TPR) repeat protein
VWKYLLALSYQANDHGLQATRIFDELGQIPDYAPSYVARAQFLSSARGDDPGPDLRKAVELDPDNRIFHVYLIQHYEGQEDWEAAMGALEEATRRFPNDFNLDLLQAKALINLGRGSEAAEILAVTHVLPSEGARESHQLWAQAHTLAALDAYDAGDFQLAREHLMQALEWPESLGQGKPYEPEERLIRFVLGRVEDRLGNQEASEEAFQAYLDATGEVAPPISRLDLLAVSALEALGKHTEATALQGRVLSESQTMRRALQEDLGGRLIQRALDLGLD